MLVSHHTEDPLIVAVEEVQVHDIQHPVVTHNLMPSQNNATLLDIDAEMVKKLKKQKKVHSSKKSNSVDADGNPIDKRKSAALQLAQEIVQRYRDRGNVLPKEWIQRKGNPEKEREYRDKNKLRKWRQSLDGNYKGNICFEEIKQYLDIHMPSWSQGRQAKFRPTMEAAQGIIERFYARGSVLPHVQTPLVIHTAPPSPSSELSSELLQLQQQLQQPPSSSSASSASASVMEEGIVPPASESQPQPLVVHDTGTHIGAHTETVVPSFSSSAELAATLQESHDAEALCRWRQQHNRSVSRKKKDNNQDSVSDTAFESVKELLDQHIPNWRDSYVDYGDPNASIKTPRPRHNVVSTTLNL